MEKEMKSWYMLDKLYITFTFERRIFQRKNKEMLDSGKMEGREGKK